MLRYIPSTLQLAVTAALVVVLAVVALVCIPSVLWVLRNGSTLSRGLMAGVFFGVSAWAVGLWMYERRLSPTDPRARRLRFSGIVSVPIIVFFTGYGTSRAGLALVGTGAWAVLLGLTVRWRVGWSPRSGLGPEALPPATGDS